MASFWFAEMFAHDTEVARDETLLTLALAAVIAAGLTVWGERRRTIAGNG